MKISASVLAANWANVKADLKKIENELDYLHMDVMDGNFVPNISFGIDIMNSLKKCTKLPFDVHLMVKKPEKYIDDLIEMGVDIITIHYEEISQKRFEQIWKKTSKAGVKLGMAINPDTPYEVIIPYLDKLDLILVMSVYPGFCGQDFIEDVVFKVECLKDLIKSEKLNIILEVDGGINNKTIKKVKKADMAVAGSYIFKAEDMKKAVMSIK